MQPLRSYLYRTTTSSCVSQNTLDFHFTSFFVCPPFLGHSRTFSHTLTLSSLSANQRQMISSRLAARLCPRLGRRLYSSNPVTPAASTSAVSAEAKQQAVAPQSPNRAATWSTSQTPRPASQSGPRFEQTIMELQPNPLSAMELLGNEPVRLVDGRRAICDGGSGPLGHPKIYINLDKPGPRSCG
jgi:NADH dehydrogenase (ubiquinone) Fe-S protein 6